MPDNSTAKKTGTAVEAGESLNLSELAVSITEFDVSRIGEVRVADCWGTGEEHLKPGQGNIDVAAVFSKLEALGYKGHFTTAFGSLQDMIEGREYLTAEARKAGLA